MVRIRGVLHCLLPQQFHWNPSRCRWCAKVRVLPRG